MQPSIAQLAAIVPVFIIAVESVHRIVQTKRERKGLPLPPGPAQFPLLGNVFDVNREEPWKTYTEWHTKYGGVVYLRLLDQDIIVLGSQSTAIELLEKRSQNYSDRPYIATHIPFGGECNFIFTPYGDYWRFCRRIFHQTFRSEAALKFRPMQLHRARQLVTNLASNPDEYQSHFSTFAAAVAMSAAYDYEPGPQDDPIVQIIEDYTRATALAVTPERSILLKLFPFLLHIPDWCPGSSLKREANHAFELSRKVVEMPYQYAEKKMRSPNEQQTFSMVSDHLTRMGEQDEPEREMYVSALKNAAVSSILASEDTTSSSLMVFTLAMVLHPHVWKRAHVEIDAVLEKNRFPDFGDRAALPYVDAIVRETVRWHPAAPLGIWHATSDSDVYNGYYIPKRAIVVANAWAMSRNEGRFPNADAFIPERFLNQDGMLNDNNPADFVFGFGRRICPGRHTADASLWCAIATMLATLEFHPARDARGKEIPPHPKWLNGVTHRPDVFPCQISTRSHVNKSTLEQMLEN